MLKDPSKEPARERAKRRWRNHDLTTRFKKMKATGEGADEFIFQDGKKPFISAEAPKPPRELPADVIENDRPKVSRLERKFKKEIRAMMEGLRRRISPYS
jgi:hypothetical protein